MSDTTAILIAVALLLGNAFFVAAEFALIAVRRTAVEQAAADGVLGARLTLRAVENVTMMMAGAQLGITMCSLGLGAIGEPAVAHQLEPVFEWAGISQDWLHPVAFVVAMSIVVFLHMTLGEMVPKNLAIAGPIRSALILGPPMYAIAWVAKPVLWLMNAFANLVLRIMRVTPTNEVSSTITTADVHSYLAESAKVGLLPENEHQLMSGVLVHAEATAADVLTPVDKLVTLQAGASAGEAEAAANTHGFSRLPVRGADGSWIGYLHLKDVLDLIESAPDEPIPHNRIRRMVVIQTDTSLPDALTRMQRSGVHLAVVLDADKEAAGVAMLEDVMETMVGDVNAARTSVGSSVAPA